MSSRRPSLEHSTISVVLPVFNEAAVLRCLCESVTRSLDRLRCNIEIIFVNDGSTDGSDRIIDEHAAEDARV